MDFFGCRVKYLATFFILFRSSSGIGSGSGSSSSSSVVVVVCVVVVLAYCVGVPA